MESVDRARVKTAIPRSGGFNPPPARLRAYTLALPTIPHSAIGTIASFFNRELTLKGGVLLFVARF